MSSPTQERKMSTPTLTAATAGAGAAGAAAGEDGAKKSTKKLFLALPLVLALIAGAAWFFLLRGSDEPAKKEEPKPGAVVALDSININLADGHYLKLKIALQASADVAEAPDGSKAQGIAGDQLTGKEVAELQTAKGRRHAQELLTEAIVKAYTEEETETVIDVYYPEFVSQ
jgi:flagellar FliL protein